MKSELRPGLAARLQSDRIQRIRGQQLTNSRFRSFSGEEQRSIAEKLGPWLALFIIGAWVIGMFAGFQVSLTILTIAGFVLAVLGLVAPALGLFGIGMLAVLDAATRNFLLTGGLLRWNTLNYWLLAVVVLNILFLLRLKDPQTRLLQMFIALLAIELLISSSKSSGIQDIMNITAAFGMLVYFARGFQLKGGMYWMGILGSLISAIGGLVYYQQFSTLPYVNPNSWAFFPLTGIFAACLAFPSSKDHRLGNFTLLSLSAVNFLWTFLSGSRGSMLVGILCLLFLFLWTRKLSWKMAFLAITWLAIGIFSLQFVEQQTYAFSRVQKFFNPQYSIEERTSGRSDIAQAGLEMFMRNPMGVGTGNFREAITQAGLASNEVAAHSGWIKVLAENGLPGILLLSAYILSFLVVGIRRKDRDLILLGLMVSSSFAAALLSKEFQGKGLWFFAAGATVLLHPTEMAQNLVRKARAAFDVQVSRARGWRRENTD